MSMPPVDKIDEVLHDVWDVVFQGFLSPELLRGLDVPVMDERAIEEFEKWSNDENKVVSSTSISEEAALVPVTWTRFWTVTNNQLQTAVKKRIPKGMQKSKQAGFNGHFTIYSGNVTCAIQLFEENVDEQLIQLQTGPCSDAVHAYKHPTKSYALQVSSILQPPFPKKAAKAPEMEVFGGYHAENKENSIVPAQNSQSNSQQSSVMCNHFTNSYGSSPTCIELWKVMFCICILVSVIYGFLRLLLIA